MYGSFQVRSAMLGRLGPDSDICAVGGNNLDVGCRSDITSKLQMLCDSSNVCVVDVTDAPLRNKCGAVR